MNDEHHEKTSPRFACICQRYSENKNVYNWIDFAVFTEHLIGVECWECHRTHWKIKPGIKLGYRDIKPEEIEELRKLAHNWWKQDELRDAWLLKRGVRI